MDPVIPAGDLTGIVSRLGSTFSHLPAETIDTAVRESAAVFGDARVTTFVPILVERAALDRLRRIPTQR